MFSKIENVLKVLAASLGVITAFGIPAVHIHFSNFGVPTEFISYTHILKAGVFPFVIFGLLAWYITWSYENFREHEGKDKWKFILVSILLAMPLLLVPILLYFVGTFALLSLFLWLYGFLFVGIFEYAFDFDVSSITIYWWTAGITIVFFIMGIVIGVLPEGAKKAIIEWGLRSWDKVKWWAPKLVRFAFPKTKRSHGGPPDHRNRDVAPATSEALVPGELAKSETVEEAPASGGAIDHEPQNGRPADGEHPSGDSPLFWAKYFIGALGLFLLLYASTVLVLVILEKTFLGLSYVALFGLGSAVVASCVLLSGLLILALVWVHSDTNARRITAHFYLVVFVLSLGGTLAVTYWTYLYPRIPTAFGGGKPYMVDVWLSGGDVPKSIGKGGSKEECEVVGKDLHCRDVALLYVDSENVILYAEKFGVFPTLVLERKVVKAIAGAQ